MLKKWFEIIFNQKISLRERMFRVVTGICMVALIIILPMGRNLLNLLILAASLIFMAAVVKIRKNVSMRELPLSRYCFFCSSQ